MRPNLKLFPRLIAQLWGTTSLEDCLIALKLGIGRRQLVQGPVIQEYENEFARRIGVRFAVSFSTGRAALFALLCSFNIKDGDEVLLQVPTHIVVPNAIRFTGSKPVYVDCDPGNFNMNLLEAEQKITPKTKALLVQHTFGVPTDLHDAIQLAQKYKLVLIEDCVHALGAQYQGHQVGSLGQAAFFSTEETKTISSTMGGMAVTDDPAIADHLYSYQKSYEWPDSNLVWQYLRKFAVYYLFTQPYLHPYTRWIYLHFLQKPVTDMTPGACSIDEMNGRRPEHYLQQLSNGQAILALRQLKRLEENLNHRQSIAQDIHNRLQALGVETVQIPFDSIPAFVRYPILVSDRVAAIKAASKHVLLGEWFSSVLEESATPSSGIYEYGSCPNAEFAAKHLVNAPTHLRINHEDVSRLITTLNPYLIRK